MPDDLDASLLTGRAALVEIQSLIQEVLKTFSGHFDKSNRTWPYQLVHGEKVDPQRGISFSTNAMIVFALALATGKIRESSLAPLVGDPQGKKELRDEINKFVSLAIDRLIEESTQLPQKIEDKKTKGAVQPRSPEPLRTQRHSDGMIRSRSVG